MSYWDKDYYELFPTSAANNTWKGWQFFDSKKNQGVIQVFCPEGSGELSQKVKLYGLNPKKTYVLTDSDGLNSYKAKGSELMEEGLPISYNRTFSSSVIFISTKEVETPALLKEYAAEYNGLTLPAIQEGDVVVSDLPYESWIMYEASSDEANPKYKPNFNTNENGGTLIVGGIPFLKGIRSHPRLARPGGYRIRYLPPIPMTTPCSAPMWAKRGWEDQAKSNLRCWRTANRWRRALFSTTARARSSRPISPGAKS